MENKKQNECLNFFKGISCWGILYMHTSYDCLVSSFVSCLVRFAIPLFFMISGYYIYNADREVVAKKVPKKVVHILKLSVFSVILYLVYGGILSPLLNGKAINFMDYLANEFTYKKVWNLIVFNQWGILWFLFALLYCYLILIPINKYDWYKKAYILIPVLIGLLIFARGIIQYLALIPEEINIIYFRNFIFMGFPFFMLGNMIHKYENHLLNKITGKRLILIMCAGTTISCIERYIVALEFFIGTLFAVVCIFIYALQNPDNRIIKPVAKIGRDYSLVMYIGHPIANDILICLFRLIGLEQNKIFLITKPFLIFISIPIVVSLFDRVKKIRG